MTQSPQEIAARELSSPDHFREYLERGRPVVIRGLVADWPVVNAARSSPRGLKDYLALFDAGTNVEVYSGDPEIRGKYYYKPGLQGFNFERRAMKLMEAAEPAEEESEAPEEQPQEKPEEAKA